MKGSEGGNTPVPMKPLAPTTLLLLSLLAGLLSCGGRSELSEAPATASPPERAAPVEHPNRKVGFSLDEGFASPWMEVLARGMRTQPGALEPVLAAVAEAEDHERADQVADVAGHMFLFDQARPEDEIQRAIEGFDDDQLAGVFLRGLFLQYGYDHWDDPLACQAFVERFGQPVEQERAFGMANGMAWGLAAADESAPADMERGIAIGQHLQGMLRGIFFEELGWQQRAHHLGARLEGELDLREMGPAGDRCELIHGFVRASTSGEADPERVRAWVERAPESCALHVSHAASRARCGLGGGGLIPPQDWLDGCGLSAGLLEDWRALSYLP